MTKNTKSLLLVIVQLLSIAYLFFSGPLIPTDIIILLVFIAGVFLGVWALYAFRGTRFSVLPEIPENAALVTAGPYRIIRHPIYTSILLITGALLINEPSPLRLIVFIVLLAVLLIKTQIEETYLDHHFKEYGNYKAQTQKLIPFLY